jgi:hypothetical protein
MYSFHSRRRLNAGFAVRGTQTRFKVHEFEKADSCEYQVENEEYSLPQHLGRNSQAVGAEQRCEENGSESKDPTMMD